MISISLEKEKSSLSNFLIFRSLSLTKFIILFLNYRYILCFLSSSIFWVITSYELLYIIVIITSVASDTFVCLFFFNIFPKVFVKFILVESSIDLLLMYFYSSNSSWFVIDSWICIF